MSLSSPSATVSTSLLWGKNGEAWTPRSRLPDFSWAGYRHGETSIPASPSGRSVMEFGARGDGCTDDTEAFQAALAEGSGVIEIPMGRYVITKVLEVSQPNVVLRGAGRDKSILVCPVHLTDIKADWGATTAGRRTSNYSWSGGIIQFSGGFENKPLTEVVEPARRGDMSVRVASTAGLQPRRRVMVSQRDCESNSLAFHLYSGDPGKTAKLNGSTCARLVCRVVSIKGNEVELDRPLRFDLAPEWSPELRSFEPAVTESGVEGIGFEFPERDYEGHFTELGYNAIAFRQVAHCWIRDVHIHNADSGIFMGGYFCSTENVLFTCTRKCDDQGCTGHHGVYFSGDDNLFTRFDYQTKFIHDLSVSNAAGNVFSNGRGVDLCLDHHRRAPYENLFTDLDAGKGSRLWMCGGGAEIGKHCAARGTFWNIRGELPLDYPFEGFAPDSINVVGLSSNQPACTEMDGKWFEPGSQVEPADLHAAQLRRRMSERDA